MSKRLALSAMIKKLTLLMMLVTLSACAPMAMFASGGNYDSSLGVQVSHDNVNTLCMSPGLRLAIWEIEGHFRKKIVVNSAYRTPWYNSSVGGASNSYHTRCMAVDFFVPGVSKSELIKYVKTVSLIGGLGCYPGRQFIHIDVRTRPQGYRQPVMWGC